MERREAVAALFASIVQVLTGTQSVTNSGLLFKNEPRALAFDLGMFSEYRITLKGEKVVTLTPEQFAEALKS